MELAALPPLPDPLVLLDTELVRTALLELGLLAVAGGLLGAWIVLRGLAFFAHAVGAATFPGLVAAEATGASPRLASLALAVACAGAVERGGRAGRAPGDVATGLLLVAALATGVVLASDVFESAAGAERLLFGTLIGLGGADLATSAAAAVLAIGATIMLGRSWTAVGFDPEAAPTLGIPVARADLLLLALIAVAAVAALPAVGALLVTSLYVVPAAVARLLTRSVRSLLLSSAAIAAVQGLGGLYVSLWLDVPPGPAIAVLGATAYALCAVGSALRPRPVAAPAGAIL